MAVSLSHPEQDRTTGKLYNSVFVIAAAGTIIGTHRNVHVVPVAEAWAMPATTDIETLDIDT
jgi:predicted amidohydrolase